MDAAEIRARLAAPPTPVPWPQAGPVRANGEAVAGRAAGDDVADLVTDDLVPAAVLVPFVLGPAPGVLLTKRTAHLSSHAGQISFPGGRIDPGDAAPRPRRCARPRRRSGWTRRGWSWLGRLDDYVTGTGYRITPVLGLLPPGRGAGHAESDAVGA